MGPTELLPPPDLTPLRAGVTQIVVSHTYGVPLEDIRAASRRSREAAFARQIAMYLSHVVFAMTTTEVATAFGRDRSTACHAFQRVEAMREDPEIDRTLGWLKTVLRAVAVSRPTIQLARKA